MLISGSGVITGFSLTPAPGSEREALWEMVQQIEGVVIGDKGYRSERLRQDLQQVRMSCKRTALQHQRPA